MLGSLFETRFRAGILSSLRRLGNIDRDGSARRTATSPGALVVLGLSVLLVSPCYGEGKVNAPNLLARNRMPLGPPYHLNFESIVRLAYAKNPTVRASREEMKAAKHGLSEFRANLSRFEPFVETRSDLSDFPNRRGAFGNTFEGVVGVKKETFEGVVLSTEVGASHSRFEFAESVAGQNSVESGAGALVRTRFEIPFFGSRRRQDRIIAQAFQESTARNAQLNYLKSYRSIVDSALSYYNLVVYYRRLVEIYSKSALDYSQLILDEQVDAPDRQRIESVKATAESNRNIYTAREKEYLTILLSYLAIDNTEPVSIEIAEYRLSPFVEQARTVPGLKELIDRARLNNPTFRVLDDAIRNTELQHKQAVRGKYDVTTFVEGTLFPIGSETFDNRLEGWTVGGGINVRLNDRRVLTATRKKTEAQIRQFRAEIEAEEISTRRKIVSTAEATWSNHENRKQLLNARQNKQKEFADRLSEYFVNEINIDQLMSTRSDLTSNEANVASNMYNTADREATLTLAIGQIFEMVGLKIGSEEPEE